MPGKENRNSQHNVFHVFVFCLILLAVVLLLINKRAEGGHQLHPPEKETTGGTVETVVANDAPPTQDIIEPAKICQTPAGRIVVPTDTACPEDRAVADTEPEAVETPPAEPPAEEETPSDLPAPTARLGQYFTFSPDLDLRADSFGCQSVFRVVSGGKSLDEIRANYRIYQDESLPLAERLAVDGFIFYDYIISFEAYLNNSGAKQPDDDVMEYFNLYQECKLELTAKNTGPARNLNDGCGLSFSRSVNLFDGQGGSIGPHGFRKVLCTKAIVSFPTGATDPDIQYFILPAAAEPTVITIDNRDRPGVEAVITVPGE
ncbi:hypothetical protein F4X86_04360 [Candidatus Saccharibacteria bacterium]|nr:hypothetical protein [Candidatus Saccharibacteria bacterium]